MFDDTEVRKNDFAGDENVARSGSDAVDVVEQYIQSHDVTFSVPIADAKVTVSPKNLNNNELTFNVKYFNEGKGATEGTYFCVANFCGSIFNFPFLYFPQLVNPN